MHAPTPLIFASSVTLPAASRARLAEVLDAALASTLDAELMTRQAHWNLRGPFFFARHELFDRVSGHLRAQADALAERVGTLGAVAHGTARMVGTRSGLAPYDATLVSGTDHLEALTSRLAALTGQLREGVRTAAELGDPASEDLLTETLRTVELDLWFLESHLQAA